MKKVVIIGLGNMGGALVKGLKVSPRSQDLQLQLFDTKAERYLPFQDLPNMKCLGNLEEIDLNDAAVILCVKPQDLTKVADSIKHKLTANTLVISILAGKTIAEIGKKLGFNGPIVRSMPNIAATVGCAATAMAANSACSETHRRLSELIFQAVGEADWTKESLMDTVTGLSGSGPAYIYMVIEALTDGGVNMGMPRELAAKLATQTVLGAATLVKETGLHPALLKDQVTTPAGTTISAIVELESHGLRTMFVSAVVAATQRSRALGKESAKESDS